MNVVSNIDAGKTPLEAATGGAAPPKRPSSLGNGARPRRLQGLLAATVLGLIPAAPVLAHHSFAVFFNADQDVIAIKGAVTAYHFTNPHGVIDLVVTTDNGAQEAWRVETNSPSILVRRGWNKDSIAAGEVITIKGWRARDGSRYMRLRSAFRADGTPIGNPGPIDGGKP